MRTDFLQNHSCSCIWILKLKFYTMSYSISHPPFKYSTGVFHNNERVFTTLMVFQIFGSCFFRFEWLKLTTAWNMSIVLTHGYSDHINCTQVLLLIPRSCVHAVMVDDHEIMELVPNIILNPGYDNSDHRMDWIDPDENANDYRTTQLNNNSIIRPFRV